MFGSWYQLYVKRYKDGRFVTGEELKRVDDTLTSMCPAAFMTTDGVPIPNAQGEYEVRCFQENVVGFVRSILEEHHGLVIEREVKNES